MIISVLLSKYICFYNGSKCIINLRGELIHKNHKSIISNNYAFKVKVNWIEIVFDDFLTIYLFQSDHIERNHQPLNMV
jgi:hypothetical protein